MRDPSVFGDLAAIVRDLRLSGRAAAVLAGALLDITDERSAYSLAPLLHDAPRGPDDRLALFGAEAFSDDRARMRLKDWSGFDGPAEVYGCFESAAKCRAVTHKLEMLLGHAPVMHNLGPPKPGQARWPIFPVEAGLDPVRRRTAPVVGLVGLPVTETHARAALSLAAAGQVQPVLILSGKDKAKWLDLWPGSLTAFHYAELDPVWALRNLEGLAFYRTCPSGLPSRRLLAAFERAGRPLLDCTLDQSNRASAPNMVAGPPDLRWLPDVWARATPQTTVTRQTGVLGRVTKVFTRNRTVGSAPQRDSIVMLPTNGVGLGHAQRLSLIADAMPSGGRQVRFAAFPSCVPLLRRFGYDCAPLVSRSPSHAIGNANDVQNYARLTALAERARGLVFDGGYPFESVVRSLTDHGIPGIWVRRGLWPEGRGRRVALEREKHFRKVIVPSEAFEELQEEYTTGPHIETVGPICQVLPATPTHQHSVRAAVLNRLELPADTRLVVSMLGGGVASDRLAQTLAVANAVEDRGDAHHLVLVWPGAVIDPALDGWARTSLVETFHSAVLAAVADVRVSACGYNTFHEALYNQWPMLYVPQVAGYMDDQTRRARSATERGVARLVEPDALHSLAAQVHALLDGGSDDMVAAFDTLDLPARGNDRAAQAILAEVT